MQLFRTAQIPYAVIFTSWFAMSALPGSEVPPAAGSSGSLEQLCVGSLCVARDGSSPGPLQCWPLSVLVFGGPLLFFFANPLAFGPKKTKETF